MQWRSRWLLVSCCLALACGDSKAKAEGAEIAKRCKNVASAAEEDKCVDDWRALSEKYPKDAIAVCGHETYLATVAVGRGRRAAEIIMATPDDPHIRSLIDEANVLRDEHVAVCEKCRALGGPPWDDKPLACRPSGPMAPPDLDELWKVNRNARR